MKNRPGLQGGAPTVIRWFINHSKYRYNPLINPSEMGLINQLNANYGAPPCIFLPGPRHREKLQEIGWLLLRLWQHRRATERDLRVGGVLEKGNGTWRHGPPTMWAPVGRCELTTGWWFGCHEFGIFPRNIGNFIIPIDELIFFRGVQTTNQF